MEVTSYSNGIHFVFGVYYLVCKLTEDRHMNRNIFNVHTLYVGLLQLYVPL